MYSLLSLLIVINWLMMNALLKSQSPGKYLLFTLSLIATYYTHFYASFITLGQAIIILLLSISKKQKRILIYCHFAAGIVFVPCLARMIWLTNRYMNKGNFWPSDITVQEVLRILRIVVSGYEHTAVQANILTVIFFGLLMWALIIGSRKIKLVLTGTIILPLLSIIAIGILLDYNYLIARYVIFICPFLAIGAAVGLNHLFTKGGRPLLVIIMLLQISSINYQYKNVFHTIHYGQGVREKKDYYGSSEFIREHRQECDAIGHSCVASVFPYYYYLTMLHGIDPGRPIDRNMEYIHHINEVTAVPEYYDHYIVVVPLDIEKLIHGKCRLWFVGSEWDIGTTDTFDTQMKMKAEAYLNSRYPVLLQKEFFGAPLTLYDLENPISTKNNGGTDAEPPAAMKIPVTQ